MLNPRFAATIATPLLLQGCNLAFDNEDLASKIFNNFDFKQQAWAKLDVGAVEDLLAIQMVDANTGYAGGKKGTLYVTKDGGATWSGQYPAVMTGQDVVSLSFLGPAEGFAASAGKVFGTKDAGNTWAPLASPVGGAEAITHLRMVTAGVGYAITAGQTYQTLDGAKTWTKVPGGVGAGGDIAIVGGTLFAGGNNVYRGVVGGDWTGLLDASKLCGTCEPAVPAFISPQEGWLVSASNNHGDGSPLTVQVLRTKDGGGSWDNLTTVDYMGKPLGAYLKESPEQRVNALRFVDAQNGWLLFARGMLATSDGGSTWIAQNQAFNTGTWNHYRMENLAGVGFKDLSALDARHAWAVAGKFIYRFDGTMYPAYHEKG